MKTLNLTSSTRLRELDIERKLDEIKIEYVPNLEKLISNSKWIFNY
jgi:hypothetical protein